MRKTVKLLMVFLVAMGMAASHALASDTVTGKVFWNKNKNGILDSVHPRIGKFVRDQGARKILPQAP